MASHDIASQYSANGYQLRENDHGNVAGNVFNGSHPLNVKLLASQ